VLIQPVEDALAADAIGGWLAVRVCAFLLGEPDQHLAGWQLVVQPLGLSWPELLIVGVGDQHRAWAAYPDEVDAEITAADAAEEAAEQAWLRERQPLAG
jgi:hypothetical protein